MKKIFATAFLTLTTALGFAQDATLVQPISTSNLPLEVKPALVEKVSSKKSFLYLRMGITDSHPTDTVRILPGLGLGYRLTSGPSAIDISSSYNRTYRKEDGEKKDTYFFTLPKANYLHYITPAKNSSAYAGAGMAWGGMKTKDEREFLGLIPNVAIGYEMNRNAAWKSFVQLDVSQPAVAAVRKGAFPGPLAELSAGVGF